MSSIGSMPVGKVTRAEFGPVCSHCAPLDGKRLAGAQIDAIAARVSANRLRSDEPCSLTTGTRELIQKRVQAWPRTKASEPVIRNGPEAVDCH